MTFGVSSNGHGYGTENFPRDIFPAYSFMRSAPIFYWSSGFLSILLRRAVFASHPLFRVMKDIESSNCLIWGRLGRVSSWLKLPPFYELILLWLFLALMVIAIFINVTERLRFFRLWWPYLVCTLELLLTISFLRVVPSYEGG